jgi:hypothetical protein
VGLGIWEIVIKKKGNRIIKKKEKKRKGRKIMRTEKIMAEIWRKKIGNLEELEKGSLRSVDRGRV